LRTGYWGEYSDLRGKQAGTKHHGQVVSTPALYSGKREGESCIMRRFIFFSLHQYY
jgi:hypothetical protein